MSILVAIDPGTKYLGVSIWEDGVLSRAYLSNVDDFLHLGPRTSSSDQMSQCNELVIEKMQVFRSSIASDLINISLISGEVAGMLRYSRMSKVTYLPFRKWKGNLPKKVTTERTLAVLSPQEKKRIELPKAVKTLGHNVYDSVGLGLYFLLKNGKRK